MITLNGKYNFANIMIDNIDESTEAQIRQFLDCKVFKNTYISIMPDCHAGKGAVIGFTMKMNDWVIPNVIGVDIGCGMYMEQFKSNKIDLIRLDNHIRSNIPHGFKKHLEAQKIDEEDLKDIRYACNIIGADYQNVLKSVGTLGGGNHFIEAGYSKDSLCVTVHSGSRNFGKLVADYFQNKAAEHAMNYFIDVPKGLEYLHIESPDALDYMFCLGVAQRFASLNRKKIIQSIREFLEVEAINSIESVHNFIGDDNIIRKGATPARLGEDVLIPFNMADGIAICKGKGSSKYNNSAPHGAGRILSRSQARKELMLEDMKEQMKDVYTTSVCKETIDEAPKAYKPMNTIIDNIGETVEIIEIVKPVYNFKAKD